MGLFFFGKKNKSSAKTKRGGSKEVSQKRGRKAREPEVHSVGGGYQSALSRQTPARKFLDVDAESSPSSQRTTGTTDTNWSASSHSSTSTTGSTGWSNAGSWDFHRHAPLFVKPVPSLTRQGSDGSKASKPELDQVTQLGQIMAHDRKLPGTWYYSSNHIMINNERVKRNIPALTRRRELDELARSRAEEMARQQEVAHGDSEEMRYQLYPCRRFGENVCSGASIRDMHKEMMLIDGDKNNILDRRYLFMGMGTATGEDGQLYMCQVFKG